MFDVSDEFMELFTRQYCILLGASAFPLMTLLGSFGALMVAGAAAASAPVAGTQERLM